MVDRHWTLLRANAGAVRLVEFLVGPLEPDAAVNLADALVAPDILKPWLENWPDVVRYFVRSVEADAAEDGTAETAALLERLRSYEGVEAALSPAAAEVPAGPVLPMHFRKDDTSLTLKLSRPSRPSAPLTTSRSRNSASRASSRSTRGRPRVFREWAGAGP